MDVLKQEQYVLKQEIIGKNSVGPSRQASRPGFWQKNSDCPVPRPVPNFDWLSRPVPSHWKPCIGGCTFKKTLYYQKYLSLKVDKYNHCFISVKLRQHKNWNRAIFSYWSLFECKGWIISRKKSGLTTCLWTFSNVLLYNTMHLKQNIWEVS